jgi:hypothetical protein
VAVNAYISHHAVNGTHVLIFKICWQNVRYIIQTEQTKRSTETQQILTDEQVEERPHNTHIEINDQSIVNEKMFCKCGILLWVDTRFYVARIPLDTAEKFKFEALRQEKIIFFLEAQPGDKHFMQTNRV